MGKTIVELDDDADTTTTGQVLKSILKEIKTVKNQDDRIASVEKSLTVVTSAVEQINSNLDRFIDTMNRVEQKNIEMQMQSQLTMVEIKNAIQQFGRIETRVDKIEATQFNGCPSLKALQGTSDSLKKGVDKTRDELTNYIENEHKWKEGLMMKMIGGGVAIVFALIGTIFNFIKH